MQLNNCISQRLEEALMGSLRVFFFQCFCMNLSCVLVCSCNGTIECEYNCECKYKQVFQNGMINFPRNLWVLVIIFYIVLFMCTKVAAMQSGHWLLSLGHWCWYTCTWDSSRHQSDGSMRIIIHSDNDNETLGRFLVPL